MNGSDPKIPATKPRLLVVDDEPGNLFTFKRALRLEFDITLASDGFEALRIFAQDNHEAPIDLVVVDYAMPKMNGAQFLAKLRVSHPMMPCILLTAYGDVEEVQVASRQYGVASVIMKPWDRDDVGRKIEHFIRIARMKRTMANIRA